MSLYKNIIPGLVSIETDKKSFFGFSFSENFNFYDKIDHANKFNFKVLIDNVQVPQKYEFRNGFYLKEGGYWYYERKIFKIVPLRFKYGLREKKFTVNNWFLKIPFRIGNILPFGKHLEDIISLELFLNGYIVFQGAAISYNNRNICLVGPSFNGKTHALEEIVKRKKGKIVSDDLIIADFENSLIYPLALKYKTIGVRKIQKQISEITNKNNFINEPMSISSIFFIQNSTCEKGTDTNNFFEFIHLCSLYFLENRFLMSLMIKEKLLDKFLERADILRKMKDNNFNFINIKNFNYNFLNSNSYDKEIKSKRTME